MKFIIFLIGLFQTNLIHAQIGKYDWEDVADSGQSGLMIGTIFLVIILLILFFGPKDFKKVAVRSILIPIIALLGTPAICALIGKMFLGEIGAVLGLFLGLYIGLRLWSLFD
jgi:hypothetical protein